MLPVEMIGDRWIHGWREGHMGGEINGLKDEKRMGRRRHGWKGGWMDGEIGCRWMIDG